MVFPISPPPPSYIKDSPTYSYRGQTLQPGDGFPNGTLSFTAGRKIIVLAAMLAGGPAASNVRVGGVACTLAGAITGTSNANHASIWYLETTASGNLQILGVGGSGRSFLRAYEIYNYTEVTPYSVGSSVTNTASTITTLTMPVSTNSIVFGSGIAGPVGGPTISSSVPGTAVDLISNVAFESATTHFSWVQRQSSRGSPATFSASSTATLWRHVVAAWR